MGRAECKNRTRAGIRWRPPSDFAAGSGRAACRVGGSSCAIGLRALAASCPVIVASPKDRQAAVQSATPTLRYFLPEGSLPRILQMSWNNPHQTIEVAAGRHSCWVVASRWEPLPRLCLFSGPRTSLPWARFLSRLPATSQLPNLPRPIPRSLTLSRIRLAAIVPPDSVSMVVD
jgi:hypothetical protein